ncbi:MAG TPA: glycosyltransferase [Candidatus Bathyarchaeia archaeon]|nr:glycosyltransferase [Candidatus Bathyarchaeia archaeon]
MSKQKKLRIAIVAPPFGPWGGPEVLVQNLTEALVKKGVDVTLFAPRDWKTSAKHIPTLEKSLWNMKNFADQSTKIRRNLIIESQLKVLFSKKKFDIIHFHSQRYAYLIGKFSNAPCVLSYHNKITEPEFIQIKRANIFAVSLSRSQKNGYQTSATIWNGIPVSKIEPSYQPGKYLIAIGRLDDQKGIDTAIQIAKRAKKKLLIFGRIGLSEKRQAYFRTKIKPHLDGAMVVHMGEVPNSRIFDYLRDAEALLFTIRRPEVCPMVIMEALACGTPVIGTKINPLPELLKNNKKICRLSNDARELVKVVREASQFDRKKCREYAEKNFDSSVMAEKYIELYNKIIITLSENNNPLTS